MQSKSTLLCLCDQCTDPGELELDIEPSQERYRAEQIRQSAGQGRRDLVWQDKIRAGQWAGSSLEHTNQGRAGPAGQGRAESSRQGTSATGGSLAHDIH